MAVIQIKGVNDYLLFLLDDEVCEDILFEQLHTVISSPSFKKKNFYPKAYFDFKSREVTPLLFMKLMTILDNNKSVLFCGIKGPKKKEKALLHLQTTIRNGEVIEEKEDCLFEGKINPGGKIVVYGNLYILGACFGQIELIGSNVSCNVAKLENASLQINGVRKENIDINEMTVFYEENGEIKMKREDVLWQEQSL